MFIQIVYVPGKPATIIDNLREAREIVNWARCRGVTVIHEIRWLQEPCFLGKKPTLPNRSVRMVIGDVVTAYPLWNRPMPMISVTRGRWTYPAGGGWEAQTK